MAFVLTIISVEFIRVPVVGAGLWLARKARTSVAKSAGVVLVFVCRLSALLLLLFCYRLSFHSEWAVECSVIILLPGACGTGSCVDRQSRRECVCFDETRLSEGRRFGSSTGRDLVFMERLK